MEYQTQYYQRPRRRKWPWLLAILVAAYTGVVSLWPAPPLQAVNDEILIPAEAVKLPWPAYGQAAIGAKGYGVVDSANSQMPTPLASTAKIMTALAVLKQKPLAVGEAGPVITFSEEDAAAYRNQVFLGGSTVPAAAGQQISQRKALEALLIPSANNIAESLARWAFGSLQNYSEFANKYAKELGATSSNFSDPSGFAPATTGTAHDLVLLGEKLMQQPVLAEIVNQQRVDLGNGVSLPSTNSFLSTHGAIGIKTGHTDQSGGCFVVAINHTTEDGQTVVIMAAVLNAPNLITAMTDAHNLAAAGRQYFESRTVVKAGQTIGQYTAPWGASANAVVQEDLAAVTWQGADIKPTVQLEAVTAGNDVDEQVGALRMPSLGETITLPVFLEQSLSGPPWHWRLWHPQLVFQRG